MSSGRINQITIYDFKGFPGKTVAPLTLNGKNLLLYGENGSGKSTIFTAVSEILNRHPTREFNDDIENPSCLKHRFTARENTDGCVILNFDDGTVLEWLVSRGRPDLKSFDELSRTSGFLDYRSILKTHFLDYENDSINLFPLVVETLLRDVEMPTSSDTYGEVWSGIQKDRDDWIEYRAINPTSLDPFEIDRIGFDPSAYPGEDNEVEDEDTPHLIDIEVAFESFLKAKRQDLEKKTNDFIVRLSQRLQDISTRANRYLLGFDPALQIAFDINPVRIPTEEALLQEVDWKSKAEMPLRSVYYGNQISHPGVVLNEARMTAIALVFYLAALKEQATKTTPNEPPSLLVLDDVLIGLDMAHRLPVLDLLKQEFSKNQGWQVMLFTYDRAWYDIAKKEMRSQDWQYYEMYAVRVGNYEQPLVKADQDHLERALMFLDEGEVKAAAAHMRTKFEQVVKWACEECKVFITYQSDMAKRPISDFWNALKSFKRQRTLLQGMIILVEGKPRVIEKNTTMSLDLIPQNLIERIEQATSWVLNPLVHSESIASYSSEIREAVSAVYDLETWIRDTLNDSFDEERRSLVTTIVNIGMAKYALKPPASTVRKRKNKKPR